MPLLAPVPRDTTADRLSAQLRARILEGELAAGEKLPPERKMAEDLGLNRVTVRAALQTLAAEGLLFIRQGSGATVADYLDAGGPSLIPAWIALARAQSGRSKEARSAIADLLAVRRALTRIVLEKVVARALSLGSQGGKAEATRMRTRLKQALAAYDEALRGARHSEDIARADIAMARAVVREANSPVLSLVVNPIAHVLSALPDLRDAMFVDPTRNLQGWRALVAALEKPQGKDGRATVDAFVDLLAANDDHTLASLSHATAKGT